MTTLREAIAELARALREAKARREQGRASAGRPAFVFVPAEESPERDRAPVREEAVPAAPPRRAMPTPRATRAAPDTLRERVLARLREPDAVLEAFVLREILDRPVALRRRRAPSSR